MIAHRLSTLERCDAVLVLKSGALQAIVNTVDEARTHMAASVLAEFPLPRPVLIRCEK
jgi:ABC-type bacteriocin/lantibiotic exporter with double-glycine peptidase domain